MNLNGYITDIRRLCCLGLPSQLVVPSILRMLHELIPSHSNLFAWIGQDFELTNLYPEENIPLELVYEYLCNFYNRQETEVCPAFSQAAKIESGITDWEQYWGRAGFLQSEFYKRLMLPQQIRYQLRAYIPVDGQTAGLLVLQRRLQDAPFSKADQSLLARVTPYIAHALKTQHTTPSLFGGRGRSGLVLLNARGEVLTADPLGMHLLYLSRHAAINAGTMAKHHLYDMPTAIRDLCINLAAGNLSRSTPLTTLHIQNAWGLFAFSAYRLAFGRQSEPMIGITVGHRLPQQIILLQSMKSSLLSAKQKEVCLRLLEGGSYNDIATKMGISPHSVNDYLKAAYRKLGVHSKDELLHKLTTTAV